MRSFSRFKQGKKPVVRLPKPLRIEKKMVHGQLVEVKIYAQVGFEKEKQDARPKLSRRPAKCSG